MARNEPVEPQRQAILHGLDRLSHDGGMTLALHDPVPRSNDDPSVSEGAGAGVTDAVELWGRRIGRFLNVVALLGLCTYFYLAYLR